ncbi:MAG: nucleoside triphosphate pyrophosphohydrolase [candidate division FCPU426 bacterium]
MPLKAPTDKNAFERLVKVMAQLRSKKGCPWDRRQTHASLKPYLIEETYELIEAIDSGDSSKLRGELGDLLLQAVFHAQLAAEKKRFNIQDVAAELADKLVRRHPHVYGSRKHRNAAEQSAEWEKIKLAEKGHAGRKSIVDGVPSAMPALLRARRVLSKAARANFQWNSKASAWAKFYEELDEFKEAARATDFKHKEEELGDVLMALSNVARYEGLNPEHALHQGVKKLARRIQGVEEKARQAGLEISGLKEKKILALWAEVKQEEPQRRHNLKKKKKQSMMTRTT